MQKIEGLYIHVPKTGGTFLRAYFAATAPQIRQVGHDCVSTLQFDLLPYFTFAFIRNPWDWYVSRYFYFRRVQAIEEGVSIGCDSGLMAADFSKAFPTFKDHMMWGLDKPNFLLTDRYTNMCFSSAGIDAMDQVFYFETMENSIRAIFDILNIKPKISYSDFYKNAGRYSINATSHKHYSYYYDDELKKAVESKDKYIIDKFGYKYEIH